MDARLARRLVLAAIVLAVVAGVAWLLRPVALPVELAVAAVGPLRETVDEDGEVRVRDRYLVAAPVSGRLLRIALRAGDSVARGQTVARLLPLPLDSRTRAEATAALEAAWDAHREALADVERVRATLGQAERQAARQRQLYEAKAVATETVERAELEVTTLRRAREAAEFRAQAAQHQVERARAALTAAATGAGNGVPVPLDAPVAGRVLRLHEESERIVAAGTPLLEIGDLGSLEVVVDLLSGDAARVRPGDTLLVVPEDGDTARRARVTVVEPAAFTKVSALGVEEQRVNVVGRLDEPCPCLGDRYRVEVRVVRWGAARVLTVPATALVTRDSGWAVFAARGGRARLVPVTPGHRTPVAVEIVGGLAEGDTIIRHPTERVADGTRIRPQAVTGAR